MADFMDVPAFDGPGVFAKATDAAWVALGQQAQAQARRLTRVQLQPSPLTPQRVQKPGADGERKRKKGAAKREAAAAGERDGRGEGADGKKRKLQAGGRVDEAGAPRRAADGERRGGGGSADKRERPGAYGAAPQAEKSRKAKPAEPLPVSGKNLGRRRRANAKREMKREARRASGGAEAAGGEAAAAKPVDAAAAAERKQKKRERLAAAAAAEPRLPTEEEARAAKKAQLAEKRRLQRSGGGNAAGGDAPRAPQAAPAAPAAQPAKAGKAPKPSLLEKAAAQLAGGRFRWLNEALYTRNGRGAWELLSGEPAMFAEYHAGFRKQTASWPRQPLDECIAWLRRCPATWAVADFGCGDARLAAAAPQTTVHSFDLVAAAPGVVACDMCAVPLEDGAVQAAVFCLSLMGTDYGLALAEAHRVLAPRGALWIAEVRSRFEGADGGVDAFLRALTALGFTLRARDESDTMFAVFRFAKADAPGAKQPRWPALKACEYKRR